LKVARKYDTVSPNKTKKPKGGEAVATDPTKQAQYEKILAQTSNLDEILIQVAKTTGIADRKLAPCRLVGGTNQ